MKARFTKRKIATIAGCTALVLGFTACQPDKQSNHSSTESSTTSATAADEQASSVETESAKVNAFFERVFENPSLVHQSVSLSWEEKNVLTNGTT